MGNLSFINQLFNNHVDCTSTKDIIDAQAKMMIADIAIKQAQERAKFFDENVYERNILIEKYDTEIEAKRRIKEIKKTIANMFQKIDTSGL